MGKPTLIELPAENRPNPWPATIAAILSGGIGIALCVALYQVSMALSVGIVIVCSGVSIKLGLQGAGEFVQRWKLGRAAEIAAMGHAQAQVIEAQAKRLEAATQARRLTDGSHE